MLYPDIFKILRYLLCKNNLYSGCYKVDVDSVHFPNLLKYLFGIKNSVRIFNKKLAADGTSGRGRGRPATRPPAAGPPPARWNGSCSWTHPRAGRRVDAWALLPLPNLSAVTVIRFIIHS